MTPETLRDIKARAKAATAGPWTLSQDGNGSPWIYVDPDDPIISCDLWPDAEFIVAAREDVPALVAEVERLQAESARLAALLAKTKRQLDHETCQKAAAVDDTLAIYMPEVARLRALLVEAREVLGDLLHAGDIATHHDYLSGEETEYAWESFHCCEDAARSLLARLNVQAPAPMEG